MNMRLYCVYSKHFVPLYERFFKPSLQLVSPDVEIIPDIFEVGGNGNFQSPGFNQALIYKWKRGLEALYENQNEIIIFTDVDIIFNRPLVPAILLALRGSDIAVTPESAGDIRQCGVNVGVLALRSTPHVRALISRILSGMILEGQWDQYLFNILLPQSQIRYSVLPHTFANARIPLSRDSILYHATCTSPTDTRASLDMKMETLTRAGRIFVAKSGQSRFGIQSGPSI